MKYTERKEFLYDMEMFSLADTQTALRIHAEYVRKFSPRQLPTFFEVDRDESKVDPLWHQPLTDRTNFSRTLDLPTIVKFEKPTWSMTRLGIVPQQRFKFWLANLDLKEKDYFPLRGDMVYYIGYRLMIINPVLEPDAYWGQTNVWLGMNCEAIVVPDGDARPIPDLSKPAPSETNGKIPADWPQQPVTGPTPHTWP